MEFQVTSLPNSYFNIFKELCSVLRIAKIIILSVLPNISLHNMLTRIASLIQPFLEQCFSKADAKISAFLFNLQTITTNFLRKNSDACISDCCIPPFKVLRFFKRPANIPLSFYHPDIFFKNWCNFVFLAKDL